MSQPPPYSLRPNKAVDRLVFVDVIRRLDKIGDLSEYMYYSLGGPFLEDFRILSEVYPAIRMISIDSDPEIIKRQRFNLPCSHLKLKRSDLSAFIAQYESRDRKSIVWLDYTRLAYADLDDFRSLLTKVATNSLVKITLRAKSADYLTDQAKREQFKQEFALLLEDPTADPPASKKDFAKLIQQMVRIASQRAFPGVNPLVYQPLSSFYYEDSTPMFTLTGIVCRRVDRLQVRQAFQDLPFANLLGWADQNRGPSADDEGTTASAAVATCPARSWSRPATSAGVSNRQRPDGESRVDETVRAISSVLAVLPPRDSLAELSLYR